MSDAQPPSPKPPPGNAPGNASGNAELQLGLSRAFGLSRASGPSRPEHIPPPKWHRRYLPHCDTRLHFQSITFRLADSLPRERLRALEEELAILPPERIDAERRRRIEAWLDAGMGCCALRHPKVAALVRDALLHFDGERYDLVAWCIMPNHVHVLIRPNDALPRIVQAWKSFTGRRAMAWNAALELGVPGRSFWMREYWDRFIRDERHFQRVIDYIHHNPVKAGLCASPEDWPWSSVGKSGCIEG